MKCYKSSSSNPREMKLLPHFRYLGCVQTDIHAHSRTDRITSKNHFTLLTLECKVKRFAIPDCERDFLEFLFQERQGQFREETKSVGDDVEGVKNRREKRKFVEKKCTQRIEEKIVCV